MSDAVHQRYYEFYANGERVRIDLSRLLRAAAMVTAFRDELGVRGFSRPEALSVVCSPIGQDILRRELDAAPLVVEP